MLGAASLLVQAWVAASHPEALGGTPLTALWRLLGFFTILTNLAVAGLMAMLAFDLWEGSELAKARGLGCFTLNMALVGGVYHLLLADLWNPVGIHWWADQGLHTAMPVLLAGYWLGFAPKTGLEPRDAVLWLGYPLAYFPYAMARGAIEGWYPYPFLDVGALGFRTVALNASAILVVMLLAGLALVGLARLLARRGAA